MANVVNRFKILDGPSHVTVHCFFQSDGLSGELVNFCLLDPTDDLFPPLPRRQSLIVKQIWYETVGFSATLAFNSLVPWPFWVIVPGGSLHHDWRFFGGIRDYSSMPTYADLSTPSNPTSIIQNESVPVKAQAQGSLTGGLDSDGKLIVTTSGMANAGASGAIVLWIEKRDRPNPQPD